MIDSATPCFEMVENIEKSDMGSEETNSGKKSRAGTEERNQHQADFGPESQVSFFNKSRFQMKINDCFHTPEDGEYY